MRKPKGKFRCISQTSICPTCKEALLGNLIVLGEHYQIIHGRLPTDGEIYQFRTYKKKEIPLDKYAEYSGAYCKNSFNEVSGGLPSLGKKGDENETPLIK